MTAIEDLSFYIIVIHIFGSAYLICDTMKLNNY